MSVAAQKSFDRLSPAIRRGVRSALLRLAAEISRPQHRGGKTIKTLKGTQDTFHRLRIGDMRVMYDVLHEDRVLLVLGIIHRRDLERWIRNR